MRCMERANRHHGGRRGRDHAVGAARRRSRDRSGGSKACRPDQPPARYLARNPAAAPGPSIPRRSRRFPSMSAPHDASVSWLRSCPEAFRGDTSVSITSRSGSKRKPVPFTVSCWDQPPEKPKACANEPKPPRCTACEVESDVPDEWLEEESLE